jgi:serine phosphatase RsbU (regulator of sigma subunit)
MEVQIAVSKIKKYATSNSGDTVEVVERPRGGVSVVLADGQSSGKGAKWISTLVVRKVISLLADGVRDGAAARAASDSLYTERKGKVSSTLNIVSVDTLTNTLVITRNNPVPAILLVDNEIKVLEDPCRPVGLYRDTRPIITEVALKPKIIVIVYSDGLLYAGDRYGKRFDIVPFVHMLVDRELPTSEFITDSLMNHALELDQERPGDDISIVALSVLENNGDSVRKMNVRLPIK